MPGKGSASGNQNLKGGIAALLAFGVYATHDVLVKFLGGTYSPVQILFFSVLFAFPAVTMILLRDRRERTLRPVYPGWTALRTGSTVITGLCAFYAFSVLPLAQTYTILFATPLIITLLSVPILGETVRLRRWLAVLMGFIGVLVALQPGQTEFTIGHLAALTAACGSALGAVAMRRVGGEERSLVLILYPLVANFVVMGLALPFVYIPMPGLHMAAAAGISLLGLVATSLVISAYRHAEAVIVAPMQYSQILWATFYGLVFFDEWPGPAILMGAVIVIASGVFILWRENQPDTSARRPVLRGFHLRHDTGVLPRIGLLVRRRRGTPNPDPKDI